MNGTLNIRLTGEDTIIRAIYNRIREASPRGPRGGYLYRCSLKERDHGIVQLYADLPLEVLGDLFAGGTAPAPTWHGSALLSQAPAGTGVSAGVGESSRLLPGAERLQIDFRRK